jgi:periplasmic divalent cation tolerance protein
VSAILLLRTTFSDAAVADHVARRMIEQRLAACASLSPTRSVYRWQGVVETAEETVVLFKTTHDRAAALQAAIAALHDYDMPVIETWDAGVEPEVAAWIYDETAAE